MNVTSLLRGSLSCSFIMTPKSQAAGKLVFNNWARPIILQQHVVQFFGIFWDWLLLLTIVTVVAMGPSNIITFCVCCCYYLAFNAHISSDILDREWHYCLLLVHGTSLLYQSNGRRCLRTLECAWRERERNSKVFLSYFSRTVPWKNAI